MKSKKSRKVLNFQIEASFIVKNTNFGLFLLRNFNLETVQEKDTVLKTQMKKNKGMPMKVFERDKISTFNSFS